MKTVQDLNPEQLAALNAAVEEINAKGGSTTAEKLLEENGTNFVEEQVLRRYNASVVELGELCRSLPYATRQTLIANLRDQVTTP